MTASGNRSSCVPILAGLLLAAGATSVLPGCSSSSRVQSPADQKTEALLKAAERGQRYRVGELIQEGAGINTADANGSTALHLAAERGHDELVRDLLARGASVNAQDNQGNTPMHLAAIRGHDKTVRELIVGGANRSATNKEGKTPADVASPKVAAIVKP
jgi:ankyrin repeat protein